ncbi:hypothetical protein O181_049604 [Austropuccinia psidii MF-1]|uniref:Uncharacterized protein n=1 Tax=Austropuccinia psidii MF-1 TaxID=1389203 RepID=A0A9Q3HNX5_9BASI|nr:hypothetical protein [Austropuccinia psidii MF-1]
MSSKLTELTESSPSALPPPVLCGSGVFSRLYSPSMASSGHFDPSQTYEGYREVEILDPACTECLAKVTSSRQRDEARWTNVGGPIPVGGRPIYSISEVPISRINTERVVKRIRRIADSPTDSDAEVVMSWMVKKLKLFLISLAIHPAIPPLSLFPTDSKAKSFTVLPEPSNQSSRVTTSQQLQPITSSSRRRDGLSPFPLPATQVFQNRDRWPIRITIEDPNMASGNQEAVSRLFRNVYTNSREVIMYANNRSIPGTASEEMSAKFAWYDDELRNDFQ